MWIQLTIEVSLDCDHLYYFSQGLFETNKDP